MRDSIEFLRGMAAHRGTKPAREQEIFVSRIQRDMADGLVLCEADGGIGKTIGYLVCGLQMALAKGLPLIVATSTVTNRDQIEMEYEKVIEYANLIGDPIGRIPFFNYRSPRDYASLPRLEEVIARLEDTHAPDSVLRQLYEIRERLQERLRLQDGAILLEAVMPYDIYYDEKVVQRHEIAAGFGDKIEGAGYVSWKLIKEHMDMEMPCVIAMTHAMLATMSPLRIAIINDQIAMVVIDEVDKLTSTDFVLYNSLKITEIDNLLGQVAEAGIDVDEANGCVDRLCEVITRIKKKRAGNKEKNVILIYDKIGEQLTKDAYSGIAELAEGLKNLAAVIDDTQADNWQSEIRHRELCFMVEQFVTSALGLTELIYPNGHVEHMVNVTDLEVFFSWDGADEFRSAAARPGALMEWLFRCSVPVLLTTAFLGEEDRSFAYKIGLPIKRLSREPAIRAPKGYGTLKFIYLDGLQPAIHIDPETKKAGVNPAHFDDIDRILRLSPQGAWEPGKCIVVLAPGYDDVEEIHTRLQRNGSNAPIFPHRKGSNINEIRKQLINSSEGGILLTVYWEGFNIVSDVARDDRRRGLIDVLVMSRIPFQPPNPILEALYTHLGRRRIFRDYHIEAKRRIHQGFNRVIRGPEDVGVILIGDSRFPPPSVLTKKTDNIVATKDDKGRDYVELLEAIPDRFRVSECFTLIDMDSWDNLCDEDC